MTRMKNPTFLIRIGMLAMILANASLWFLKPYADLWRGFTDGVTGALFGISFACLLLAARITGRNRYGCP